LAGPTAPFILVGGWALGAFLAYILSLLVLDRLCPWKKLVISAEFDGILPKEAREKARAAKDDFDNLYLIVDQQHRWKSALLPDPRPRALDPPFGG
jgi:surfactin synthase thioesterase subunit